MGLKAIIPGFKVTFYGYAQDSEKEENARFEQDIEWFIVPRVGETVYWETRLRTSWKVARIYHDIPNQKILVHLV